jgi:hypothetical protein
VVEIKKDCTFSITWDIGPSECDQRHGLRFHAIIKNIA